MLPRCENYKDYFTQVDGLSYACPTSQYNGQYIISYQNNLIQMHEGTSKAHKYVRITMASAYNTDIGSCSHFNLEFQGGAFLQLILTLTAISSRVAMLLTEKIRPGIEQSCQALHKLLHFVLHVRGSRMNLCYSNTPSLVRSRSKSTILGGLFL